MMGIPARVGVNSGVGVGVGFNSNSNSGVGVETSGVGVDIQETCRSWSWSWNSRSWSWSWYSRDLPELELELKFPELELELELKLSGVGVGIAVEILSIFFYIYMYIYILAPKLTSHACALRVCLPPAAIAVTAAISQTSICKALGINSPSHAQMNKQRHKTWSFCLKYCILSMSSKILRQMGGIFQLWQFLLAQIAHGRWPEPWDQEMTPCKQMETMIIPTSLHSKTLLFIRKMKDAPLNCMIRI